MFPVETLQKRKFQELLKKEIDLRRSFRDPSYFDTLSTPKNILGREDKIKEILSMGTEAIPHIDNVNETLKILLSEVKILNQTMQEISLKLDRVANDMNRIP